VPEHYSWWSVKIAAGCARKLQMVELDITPCGARTLLLVLPELKSWWCLNVIPGGA
jgi:hypothetical protein